MPELDDLFSALRADTAKARWDDATSVRRRADRRARRRQIAAVAAVAAIVLVLGGAKLVGAFPPAGRTPGTSGTPTPTGIPAPTASPTPTASPAATGSPTASPPPTTGAVIPADVLLTPADVGPGSTSMGVYDQPAIPNPFLLCGVDGFPGSDPALAAKGTSMTGTSPYSTVAESVLAFRPGTARAAMTGLDALLAGACRGHFTVVARDLGGDGSVLLRGEDAEPGVAGGRRIGYLAIVRRGDRIAWVKIVDYANRPDFASYSHRIGVRAEQRLCAPGC